ncbi:MAG: cysteine hydrolase [Oscillospiraceae bacterium]|nr:cysteine hydrolase [Oscillospiraceae bacterium]
MKYLIVVDMQNDFIDGALGTAEAQEILPAVEEKIRGFDGTVIYTRDTHAPDYMDTQEGANLPVIHCVKGEEGWRLPPVLDSLREKTDSPVFDKPTFGSVDLGEYMLSLYKLGKVDSIELIGVCTDICVISNALLLKAFMPEVPISVDSSCCAGTTVQNHDNALAAMKMCQIAVR